MPPQDPRDDLPADDWPEDLPPDPLADPAVSDAPESDAAGGSDADRSDAAGFDAPESDAAGSDAAGSDAAGSDAAGGSDADGSGAAAGWPGSADGELAPDPSPAAASSEPAQQGPSAPSRLLARYVAVRARTMERDGGPGAVLRWSARAPMLSTLALAVAVGAVLVATFGVPPVSPLFLIPVVCGPVYPWLRLESRAQAAWRERSAG